MIPQELNDRVAARVKGWKAGQHCNRTDLFPARSDDDSLCMWTCPCGFPTKFREPEDRPFHDIPAPEMSQSDNIVAMIEWYLLKGVQLRPRQKFVIQYHGFEGHFGVDGYYATSLSEALALAIDSVKEAPTDA